MTAASDPLAQMIDADESFGAMFTHALHILPVALALVLPVVALGTALLYWVRRGSLTTTMTVLVLVPIIAMMTGVLGVSGFMFNATPRFWPSLFKKRVKPSTISRVGKAVRRRRDVGQRTYDSL